MLDFTDLTRTGISRLVSCRLRPMYTHYLAPSSITTLDYDFAHAGSLNNIRQSGVLDSVVEIDPIHSSNLIWGYHFSSTPTVSAQVRRGNGKKI